MSEIDSEYVKENSATFPMAIEMHQSAQISPLALTQFGLHPSIHVYGSTHDDSVVPGVGLYLVLVHEVHPEQIVTG